jgi:hypothetical protein
MRTILPFLAVFLVLAAGCVSKSTSKKSQQQAFLQGQQQGAVAAQQQAQSVVWFRGQLRHPRILWREGMKLSQGLAAAEYTGTLDPRSIRVIRHGQSYTINPNSLLRGLDDPELLPGDIVEVPR